MSAPRACALSGPTPGTIEMMTELLNSSAPPQQDHRARRPRETRDTRQKRLGLFAPVPPVVAGVLAAVRAAVFSAIAVTVLVLLAWAGAGARADASTALRAAGLAWLVAHAVDVHAGTGVIRLSPLGLMLIPASTLAGCAGRAVTRTGQRRGRALGRRELSQLLQGLVLAYLALAIAVAFAVGHSPAQPSLPGTALAATAVATVAGGIGILRALRLAGSWPFPALPAHAGTVLAGAVVAVAAMLSAGALVLAASLALHADRINGVDRSLHAGVLGSALLAVLGVAFLPNAVICSTAYALGPGFAVGAGTTVAPSGVVLGTLPSFPLLAALPGPGQVAGLALLPVLAPLVAGVLCGMVVARRAPGGLTPDAVAATAAASGAGAGLILGLLAALAGGSLGDGRLATMGPSPVRVAVIAALELGFAAAAAAWLVVRRRPR